MTFAQNPVWKARIAITLGDINGIGPEVALKAISDVRLLKYMDPILIGPQSVVDHYARELGIAGLDFVPWESGLNLGPEQAAVLDTARGEPVEMHVGHIVEQSGRLSMEAVGLAVDLCTSGDADAMVTAPISKEAVARAGYDVPGHTEFIAGKLGTTSYTMMMIAHDLRIGLVTTHIPLAHVARRVTRDAILEKLLIIGQSLRDDFGISRPAIAVLGLNPHAGDGGVIGLEENGVIGPGIAEACAKGVMSFGPFPADGFFATRAYQRYDATLAMYHDQGLVPFKTLAFNSGINFTAGLPIVRTSPDHGTAFDIAGQGTASPESMRQAIYLALDLARARAAKQAVASS